MSYISLVKELSAKRKLLSLKLRAEGLTLKQIGERMHLSAGTVARHLDATPWIVKRAYHPLPSAWMGSDPLKRGSEACKTLFELYKWRDAPNCPEIQPVLARIYARHETLQELDFRLIKGPTSRAIFELQRELVRVGSTSNKARYLLQSVEELELSVRAQNCLRNARIDTIGGLLKHTEAALLKTKNFGKKSLQEIQNELARFGLVLGSES